MTTDPTLYPPIHVPSPQPSPSAQSSPRRQQHDHHHHHHSLSPGPNRFHSQQTLALSSANYSPPPSSSSSIATNDITNSRATDHLCTAQHVSNMMLTTYAQSPPTQYSHTLISQDSQSAKSKSSNTGGDDISAKDPTSTTIAIAPAPSSSRLTLPKPPTCRLPVRMGLSDPRVHNYLTPSKPTSHVLPTPTTAPFLPSMSRQQTLVRSDHQSTTVRHPFRTQQSNVPPQSADTRSTDLRPDTSASSGPRRGSSYRHGHPNGIDRFHSVYSTETRPVARVQSNSPGHLPSPSPSRPSASPESMLIPPDFVWVGLGKGSWAFDPTNPHMVHQLQYEEQQERMRQKGRTVLSSPPTSESDLYPDSRTLPPLFPPPHNAPQTSQSSQTPQAPQASQTSQASQPPSPLPTTTTTTTLGPTNMAASLSRSSNTSNSSNASLNSFNPLTDYRAVSPPLTSVTVSSKHHHPRVPIRSPERDGHELMMTSVIDTNSSAYLNMDYYNIYRQQPLLLRPEGGRYDDKRAHGNYVSEENNQPGLIKLKSKPKARIGDPTDKGAPGSGNAKPQRKHSISLQATGTHRVLRHEVAHIKRERDSSLDVLSSLGIQDLRRSMSEGPYSSRASSRMSISHLLTSDDDSSSTHGTGGFERGAGSKRKMYHSNEIDEETPKRTRMSRKRAAELGLLDEDGNLLLGRKRSKKVHDPEHVSPAGFRHGGERTVQEPEEPITLDSDIGPISMLDRISQPTVIWKGHPMSVVGKPGYELLHPHEVHIASTLRLSPAQYLSCKKILIMASREYHAKRDGKPFRKSDAQKLCRIDVNKTSRLWEVFAKIGWLEGISEKDI